MSIQKYLDVMSCGKDLTAEEARTLFDRIFDGALTEEEIEAVLVGLRNKGEAVSEIQGAVQSMRAHMNALEAPEGCTDIVGTGGDHHGTLNISSAATFVVAGAGVPVAKHGNRAASSLSGASDVLSALGINLDPPWEILKKAIETIGVVFLFAPRHHPAMRYVAPVRGRLKTRTIFNLLGPLTNPANVKRHMIGVFDRNWSMPMAETLQALGSEAAWIAHGADALDELSTTGLSHIVELKNGILSEMTIAPDSCGLKPSTLEALKGRDAAYNAERLRALLDGARDAYRDIVLLNAAGALVVAEQAVTIKEGVKLAAQAIDSGAAKEKLEKLVEITNP